MARTVCAKSMLLVSLLVCCFIGLTAVKYDPNWNSIDSRPLPSWYDEAKIGIFIHWGVFSVPAFGSEWFWWNWQGIKNPDHVKFMADNYKPGFTYAEFAPKFTGELFNATHWADVFNSSGARYVVLTSKHHEGFTLWPSNVSWNWNAMDVGPHKDLVGELAGPVRNRGMKFGLYHSLFEWFHPLYLADKSSKWATKHFVKSKTMPELYEIVNAYRPDIIWSDGEWEAPDTYWNSTDFLAWLYNESPVKDTVVTNDRWGKDTLCKHGGYYTCVDRYNPGILQNHKWENCMTLDKSSWGYNRRSNLTNYLTIHETLTVLASTVSCGGNLLINVGPTADGLILPIFEERLRELGQWLKVNGEAIYSSEPWTHQNDTYTPDIWYTSKVTADGSRHVYAIVLHWPLNNQLHLASVTPQSEMSVNMLGHAAALEWKPRPRGGVVVAMPALSPRDMPSQHAWVLKFQHPA
ncbi:PREDICTED: alpha-L-fucosidase-like [Priapulus caudatus]|uniref:alpha-L-fucosidase n=1 Tax=Priapulus caudatus TaxID=37621 RepID=A0ABM1E4G2_PRICU|nr:PREDICTED: alpha-L-fucosidase-like [Priapulus caudatus]